MPLWSWKWTTLNYLSKRVWICLIGNTYYSTLLLMPLCCRPDKVNYFSFRHFCGHFLQLMQQFIWEFKKPFLLDKGVYSTLGLFFFVFFTEPRSFKSCHRMKNWNTVNIFCWFFPNMSTTGIWWMLRYIITFLNQIDYQIVTDKAVTFKITVQKLWKVLWLKISFFLFLNQSEMAFRPKALANLQFLINMQFLTMFTSVFSTSIM